MITSATVSSSKRNYILQQGLEAPSAEVCGGQYSALLFQPRVVGPTVLLGVILQSPVIFLVLSAVLWWSALLPTWNPFDAIYNRLFASRPDAVRLGPAQMPRRFSQGMAGTFALGIGLAFLASWQQTAIVLEVLFLIAAAAISLGRFCLGSFVYYLVTGKGQFALRTLPWARG
ncbi:MAG: DUF4395 family protein [Vicinamibacteria bacterium]